MEAVTHIADDDAPWDDVLKTAKEVVGADAATLIMFNGNQDLLLLRQTGIDANAEKEYTEYYYQHDAIAQAALASPSGRWWDSTALQATTQSRMLPFYADYMPRHRMGQVLAFVIVGEPERRAAISFQRMSSDDAALEKLSSGKVGAYVRALAGAISTREHTSSMEYARLEAMLSSIGDTVLIAGVNGRLYRCSARSYELLGEAGMLAAHERAITHPRSDIMRGLLSALARAAIQQTRTYFSVPTSWGEGLHFDIAPAASSLKLSTEPALLVRIKRHSVFSAPDTDQLVRFFSITPAEARTLSALIQGHPPHEHAVLEGISERTVRNHVASLMKKMSCTRQAELVRLGSLL
jgi:DNA-binding CsgD family transcriptional regulator